jgi:ankyrin repeat protein
MVLYGAYEEMVRVLIEDGADLDARTFDNETPLELALIKGHAGVKRIIEEELIRKKRIRQNSAS